MRSLAPCLQNNTQNAAGTSISKARIDQAMRSATARAAGGASDTSAGAGTAAGGGIAAAGDTASLAVDVPVELDGLVPSFTVGTTYACLFCVYDLVLYLIRSLSVCISKQNSFVVSVFFFLLLRTPASTSAPPPLFFTRVTQPQVHLHAPPIWTMTPTAAARAAANRAFAARNAIRGRPREWRCVCARARGGVGWGGGGAVLVVMKII